MTARSDVGGELRPGERTPREPDPDSYVLLPSDGGALLRRLAGGADQGTLPAGLTQTPGRWTNSNGGREAESSPEPYRPWAGRQ